MIGQTCRTCGALGLLLLWGALSCSAGGDEAADSAGGTSGSAGDSAGESGNGGVDSTGNTSTSSSTSNGNSTDGDTASGSGGSSSAGGSTTAGGSDADASTTGSEGGASAGSGSGGASGDLLYADVVGVSVSGEEGAYTFAVSIESADIDCSQYADFWEILSEAGDLVLRHTLTHSHTDENGTTDANAPGNTFTRSGGPVPIESAEVVIVRAHLSNLAGYNGVAMRGSPAAGFSIAPDVGSEFAAEVLDEPPAPPMCLF